MPDADELRREIKNNHNELKEQNREQKEQSLQLAQMIKDLASNQKKSSEETTQRLGSLEDRQDNIEKRLEKLETGGTEKGEHSFRGRHMLQIEKARYGINVLGMREKVSELNAKKLPRNKT